MVKRTIYIPERLESEITNLSKEKRRSFSAQVLVMLEYYIDPPVRPFSDEWLDNLGKMVHNFKEQNGLLEE